MEVEDNESVETAKHSETVHSLSPAASTNSLPRISKRSPEQRKLHSEEESSDHDTHTLNSNEREPDFDFDFPPELVPLFRCIDKYEPRQIEIKTELKCFIPPYIPSIGEADPFLKVPRPDGVPDGLGLSAIDEAALVQSDPAVLELQLQAKMKKRKGGNVACSIVRSIENAAENPLEIDKWIQSTDDLHRSKSAPEVMYRFPMPDEEEILSAFPEELADALENQLADALDPGLYLSVEEYATLICSLLDLPLRGREQGESNLMQNLHYLFSIAIEYNTGVQSDTVSVL